MPMLARMKLMIEEELYPPRGTAKGSPRSILTYVGPNAAKIYPRTREIIKGVFNATDADIHEEIYDWGKDEKEKFRVRFMFHRDLDKFTYYFIIFTISGESGEKGGKCSVTMRPLLRTEYPQDTLWERTIFYEMIRVFWHRIFYHNSRREYIWEGRNLMNMVQDQLHEYFKELREQHG